MSDPLHELCAMFFVYRDVEERYRHAVRMERRDEFVRRRIGVEDLARPYAEAGEMRSLGLALEAQLPHLVLATRSALDSLQDQGRPWVLVALTADFCRCEAHDLEELLDTGWRDPWKNGALGAPAPYDPPHPRTAVDR